VPTPNFVFQAASCDYLDFDGLRHFLSLSYHFFKHLTVLLVVNGKDRSLPFLIEENQGAVVLCNKVALELDLLYQLE